MTAPIGIGIISFAHGHSQAYCQRMLLYDDVRLVACWDDDVVRGQKAAETYGMIYTPHLDELLANEQIQAVIVTCETNRHAEMILAAAAAGKHILCQKPLALSLADCDRIITAVQGTGIKFQMAYQMRHDPSNQRIKELVSSGALGRIGLLRRRHCIPVLFNPDFYLGPTRWHVDPQKNMGMFMDDASHATDFIHWILGKPASVMAEIENTLTQVAPDDTGVAIYRFASGTMAVLTNSSVILAGENTTEVYGDQGVLIQNYDDLVSTHLAPINSPALKLYRKENPTWVDQGISIPSNHGERIMAVPRAFIDCLKNDTSPTVTAEDGRVSVEMVLGAYQSARTGCRVYFPLEQA
jgi:predicted dehydrogenase